MVVSLIDGDDLLMVEGDRDTTGAQGSRADPTSRFELFDARRSRISPGIAQSSAIRLDSPSGGSPNEAEGFQGEVVAMSGGSGFAGGAVPAMWNGDVTSSGVPGTKPIGRRVSFEQQDDEEAEAVGTPMDRATSADDTGMRLRRPGIATPMSPLQTAGNMKSCSGLGDTSPRTTEPGSVGHHEVMHRAEAESGESTLGVDDHGRPTALNDADTPDSPDGLGSTTSPLEVEVVTPRGEGGGSAGI